CEVSTYPRRAGISAACPLSCVFRACCTIRYAFDFPIRCIMEHVRRFCARPSSEPSRASGIPGVASEKIKNGKIQLEPFDVRAAHLRPAGVDAIHMGSCAAAVERPMG